MFLDSGLPIDDRGACNEHPVAYLARSLGRADASWLEATLRKRNACIAHLHTFGSHVLGTRAAQSVGAKIVRTEHSTRVYDDPSCWPFSRWSLARSDAVVCISRHVAQIAMRKASWVTPKLRVIHNGVDTRRFLSADVAKPNEHGPLRLLALGRLDRRKGLDIALHALAATPDASLTIVGDGSERTHLVTLTNQLNLTNRVHFAGFSDDVRGAIRACDAVVSSARTEGLGIALLEAMALGRPVIALPTGGIPEFVIDGDTGWLAAEHTAAALACILQHASRHRAEIPRRGKRAQQTVEALFSIDAMRERYEQVYASLEAHRHDSP